MAKKRICFIAQFPPPIHGLSKAVETLYNSSLQNEFDLEKVDIKNNKHFLKNFIRIFKSKAELFYFTISQTKGGNIRDLIILKLLEIQHKKCIIHLHGSYYRQLIDNDLPKWQRKLNYKAIDKLSGTIVLGNSLKSIFADMLPDNKIFVVPNCVDSEYLISNEEFDKKISYENSKKVKDVLYLSNFIYSKGYPEVLKMARLEKQRCEKISLEKPLENKKLHFHFAGKFFEDKDKRFFFNYIKKYHLEDYVTYHGVVNGDEKRELLNKCDIFILLTRYPNEGQPISILEAMGNGMMIVTTNHAGIPDVIENDKNGILIDKGNIDIKKLYNLILNKIDSNKLISIMEINRGEVKNAFNQEIYIENIKNIFEM